MRRKDKQKHNESESRRRARIAEKFQELKDVSNCPKPDRYHILAHAIDMLRSYEEEEKSASRSAAKQAAFAPKPLTVVAEKEVDPTTVPDALSSIAAATVALDGRFRDCNVAFCELIGSPRTSILSSSMFNFSHPTEMLATFAMVKRLLTGEIKTWETDRKLLLPTSAVMDVHMTLSTVMHMGKAACYLMQLIPKVPAASLNGSASSLHLSLLSTPATASSSSSSASSSSAVAPPAMSAAAAAATSPLTGALQEGCAAAHAASAAAMPALPGPAAAAAPAEPLQPPCPTAGASPVTCPTATAPAACPTSAANMNGSRSSGSTSSGSAGGSAGLAPGGSGSSSSGAGLGTSSAFPSLGAMMPPAVLPEGMSLPLAPVSLMQPLSPNGQEWNIDVPEFFPFF